MINLVTFLNEATKVKEVEEYNSIEAYIILVLWFAFWIIIDHRNSKNNDDGDSDRF